MLKSAVSIFDTLRASAAPIWSAWTLQILQQTGISPIRGATSCRFRRPLTCPDAVSVGVRVVQIEVDRFEMHVRLVSHKLETIAAKGTATLVACDYQHKRKAELPIEVQKRIQTLEKSRGK